MRTFGVEEELLLVDAETLQPIAAAGEAIAGETERPGSGSDSGCELAAEFQQEQLEVVSPPRSDLAGQLAAIAAGRACADAAAARAGARVLALATAPAAVSPHMFPTARFRRIGGQFRLTATEQLTNGFHIHVQITSREEGVAVLDRIRLWLHVLLALSANSPFWKGGDSGFASYRYQAWSRWPTSGPSDVFGSEAAYDEHRALLLATGVPLDSGMLYFDARLCERHPTLEVRVADVCLDPEHAAVIATVVRALVETAAREWTAGLGFPSVPAAQLRVWSWQASRWGLDAQLIDPGTGTPRPAGDVVIALLDLVRPVLREHGEEDAVEAVLTRMLREGTGSVAQREAYAQRQSMDDVLAVALEITHTASAPRGQAPV